MEQRCNIEPTSIHAEQPREKSRLADVLEVCALLVALLLAVALCCTSFLSTCRVDPLRYLAQHIQTTYDNLPFNLAVTFAAILLLRVMFLRPVTRRFARGTALVLFPLLAAFGIFWVTSAKAVPISDAGNLYNCAVSIVQGDTAALSDTATYDFFYFFRFPFQFAFLSYLEWMIRIFGAHGALIAVPVVNVLMLVSGYWAIVRTTEELFSAPRVTLLSVLFLSVCWQPLFACTWMYGMIPSFACSAWAFLFAVRYLRNGSARYLIAACATCTVAVCMKPNAWITVIAIGIVFILHGIRHKSWRSMVAALLLAAACFPLPKLAKARYEALIGADYGSGYPMSIWLVTGMQEGPMASGWYNGYSGMMWRAYGQDTAACDARAKADALDRVAVFSADPAYARAFYVDKFSSQWNEPTFMSIWLSMACESYGERGEFVSAMYDFDGLGGKVAWVQNYYLQLLYAGLLLSLFTLLFHRRADRLLYPIYIVGGVLFHLLFEACAKYPLAYLPFICPLAAYGILSFCRFPRHKDVAPI